MRNENKFIFPVFGENDFLVNEIAVSSAFRSLSILIRDYKV
ncbi:hypothetical protein RV07_GL000859 [Enterococcus malodoratus]|nr:hypothetical protein RV07_GL000859 [Enterococcus malodoratus]